MIFYTSGKAQETIRQLEWTLNPQKDMNRKSNVFIFFPPFSKKKNLARFSSLNNELEENQYTLTYSVCVCVCVFGYN